MPGATVHVMGPPRPHEPRAASARILLPHRGRLVTTVAKRVNDPFTRRIMWSNRPFVAVRAFQSEAAVDDVRRVAEPHA